MDRHRPQSSYSSCFLREPHVRYAFNSRFSSFRKRQSVLSARIFPSGKVPGMAVWRERLFAAMHLNANLPAAYFGVPTAQVVEVGLEVEI
jgi:K+ transporter